MMITKLAKELADRMSKVMLAGLVVSLQFKLTNFSSFAKQMKQPKYVWTYEEIQQICYRILDAVWPCEPVRLISLSVSECKKIDQIKKDKSLADFT